MATAAFQPQTNFNNYLNRQNGPSSPDTYLYGQNPSSSMPPMADEEPQWKPTLRKTAPENYRTDVKQLRPRRQPLYVPAALRPTEPGPIRNIAGGPRPPDTPPASQGNSFDSAHLHSQLFGNGPLPLDGRNEQQNESGAQVTDMSRVSGTDVVLDEVTGPPTTAHWKPDATAKTCAICSVPFTWWFRRHHCRRCGHVVCDNHSKHKVPLDQNARLHPHGHESKACNTCYNEWKAVLKLRDSRSSSVVGSQTGSQDTPAAVTIPQKRMRGFDEQRVGSIARSEGGMIWSTF